jgi:DNA ligase (NAD+)
MNKLERMKELVTELNIASEKYYNGQQSNLSDKEWDDLFNELKLIEQETKIILSSSPTQSVGYEVKNNLEKVTHTKMMLSLDKTKDVSLLQKFLGDEVGVLSWKEDGLTIVLTYVEGKLIDAVTRGNGEVGSRILHNTKVFKAGVPLTINYKGKLVVRGEGLISKEDFDIINHNDEYSNPRNLASGSIMQLESKIAKQRKLQFKAFSIAECDETFDLYSTQLEWLKTQGFNTVEYLVVSKDTLAKGIDYFKNEIEKYQFATDGLVLMFNDLIYGEKLGSTSHHNLNAYAYKWTDLTVETILRDIQFQVGRTGVLTPVALFDKVEIENSMVEKASLHNLSILKSLELGIGDTITAYKANMIIPQIDDNLTRSNTFILPTKCPSCGEKVGIKETDNAEFLVCENPNCNAKLVQKISHYCSRDAMNIMGVSESILESLISKGFIKTIPDLYSLDQYKNQIVKLDGFGLKSYNNILKSIETSKTCKLANLLFAVGIPNVGRGTAKDISKYFKGSIDEFKQAINDSFNFSQIEDIGETTNKSIYEYFSIDNNILMFSKLVQILNIEKEEIKETNSNSSIQGLAFVVTGEVVHFKNRKELEAKILELGGKLTGSVSKNTNYLLNNDINSPSSKNQKAKQLNIPIITEDMFLEMIK